LLRSSVCHSGFWLFHKPFSGFEEFDDLLPDAVDSERQNESHYANEYRYTKKQIDLPNGENPRLP